MEIVATIDELKVIWSKYKEFQLNSEFVSTKNKRKEELENAKKQENE